MFRYEARMPPVAEYFQGIFRNSYGGSNSSDFKHPDLFHVTSAR
jgi:hypothetical protein